LHASVHALTRARTQATPMHMQPLGFTSKPVLGVVAPSVDSGQCGMEDDAPALHDENEGLDDEEDVLGTTALVGSDAGSVGERARAGLEGGSSGSRSAKQTAKAKAGAKGKKFCRGCRKQFDPSYSKSTVSFCQEDNRALDRIGWMAKSEGKGAMRWLSETRKDDAKVQKMLANYWEAIGGRAKWKDKTPAGAKWSFADYKESVEVITSVSKSSRGKMMWEKELGSAQMGTAQKGTALFWFLCFGPCMVHVKSARSWLWGGVD